MSQTNDAKKDDKKKDAVQDDNARKDDTPQLGHFLDYDRHWLEALELLKSQLEMKKKNRHFNTLDMFYYEKLGNSFGDLENEDYFNSRIANNLFYGLRTEFAVFPYTIPKSNLGLRRQKFMTCPMRVLYYAVGIYLVELSQQFLAHYKSPPHIHSYYGGDLTYDVKEGKLSRNYNSIFYKPQYQKFDKRLRQENENNTERKVIIRLDIQNYFDEFSVSILLDLLKRYLKPSMKISMCFDEITRSQLVSFFDFVASGSSGIPQLNNDVISSFIGNLLLVFGDLILDDKLFKNNGLVEDYAIIRFMDDIFISITFHGKNGNSSDNPTILNLRDSLNSLVTRIADCFYENLELRFNPKTEIFQLRDDSEKIKFQKSVKKVSRKFSHEIRIPDEENDQSLDSRLNKIFNALKELKSSSTAPHFQRSREVDDDEVLKAVYDKDVQHVLKKSTIKTSLQEIFMGPPKFDFELTNADPTPIIILIIACDDVRKNFEIHLRSKTHLTSSDIFLILSYLCQIEFTEKVCEHDRLLNRLKQNSQMKGIIEIYEEGWLLPELPGYYELTAEQILEIKQPYVIDQIRLRVLAEQKGEYSVALNHLLNEIHAICRELDCESKSSGRYEQPDVDAYLQKRDVSNLKRAQIENLFDRRNKSTVSHADPSASPLIKDEYFGFHDDVGECLKYLL